MSLDGGSGDNNQLVKLPQAHVTAEPVHKSNAGDVVKQLNASAPILQPGNRSGSPTKSTKDWVDSSFAKENGCQLVTTNHFYQEIPSQTFVTTINTKEREKHLWSEQMETEIEEGEIDAHKDDEQGKSQMQ
ncbi:hypothetical protein K7X08_032567 [Anisodus acutangulus]|uniref:Uncharacterized protein n=1 Tax=Anisodus acutangulus TaxID=402998 RepID=A0A9Q1MUL0_9SOLA|nr:hypothetical protein K7X08_032567 [Anisodus acutangulus]